MIQLIRLVAETLAHTATRPLATLAAGEEEEDEMKVREIMIIQVLLTLCDDDR